MKNIVVFGGTFDPPTIAHEKIIGSCLALPEIDEVWVMPSGQRLDKPHMLDNRTRLDMLEAIREGSFRGIGRLVISDFEMGLPQPTHTYDTVQALSQAYPACRFSFVFGADSYQTMHTWEHGAELQRELPMFIVPRNGAVMPTTGPNVRPLDVPDVVELAISSTKVREAYYRGESVDRFVSRAVGEFLSVHHCYSAA